MSTTTLQAPVIEVLQDVSPSGRARPWREKKMANELLSLAYEGVNPHKADRLRDCATYLSFAVDQSGHKRLEGANLCRVRLCPVCSWRRSLKVHAQMSQIIAAAERRRPYAYVLLTLTVRNVSGDDLSATLDALFRAWNRFAGYSAFKAAVRGWYRGLEVTHNCNPASPNYGTYHPHFHVLLAVLPSYFTSRDYLSREKWRAMWQRAARLDYEPQVDVRRVKGNTAAAVAEVAKYAVKDADYIIPDDWDLTVDTVRTLDAALDRRRLVAFGGLFAELHRLLHLDDAEDGDLVHTDDDPVSSDGVHYLSYAWFTGYRQYIGGPERGIGV